MSLFTFQNNFNGDIIKQMNSFFLSFCVYSYNVYNLLTRRNGDEHVKRIFLLSIRSGCKYIV